jgi:lysophospholipase L1-like esterase
MVDGAGAAEPRRAVLVAGMTLLAGSSARTSTSEAASIRPGDVVLLGDSVFDNASYVSGELDVVTHLRALLPKGWTTYLAAVDGAVAGDVRHQLSRMSREASALVISVGGNDALRREGVLGQPARTVGEGLAHLTDEVERFRQNYQAMLEPVLAHGIPTALCTIYDPRFADPLRRQITVTGLALFNDVITREAFKRRLPVIDLRLVCDEDTDFANPIEPSVTGGRKIAGAIARFVVEHDARSTRSSVFADGGT